MASLRNAKLLASVSYNGTTTTYKDQIKQIQPIYYNLSEEQKQNCFIRTGNWNIPRVYSGYDIFCAIFINGDGQGGTFLDIQSVELKEDAEGYSVGQVPMTGGSIKFIDRTNSLSNRSLYLYIR